MPEYVYALHDFIPENPDEVPFKAGEKIEVIEKDDLYQDGWWQVCCPPHLCFGGRSLCTLAVTPTVLFPKMHIYLYILAGCL